MLTKDITKRKMALDKRLTGMTLEAIARDMGISRQRVEQWLCPPAEIRQMVYDRAGGVCEVCGIRVGRNGHYHTVGSDIEDFTSGAAVRLLCIQCHRRAHHVGGAE